MPRPTALSRKLAAGFAASAALFLASAGDAADVATPALTYDLSFAGPAVAADHASGTAAAASVDPVALDCMAKVVHHESRGQPHRGMLAVAQTLVNRLHDAAGRFGASICGVANQPGQFFHTAAYNPRRDGDWDEAVAVARETLTGGAADAAPGALYFHAAGGTHSGFFRGRQRVAAIGGQVFYR